MKTAIAISLVFSAILVYGYWHVSSYGSLYISVMDLSDPEHPRPIPEAELWFLDSANHVLAQAKADNSSGVISISQPASYACQKLEQLPFSPKTTEQWRLCFKKQSRWLMTWIRQVKSARLKSNTCWLPEIPIVVSSHTDSWWFWWVPLRHIGGKPYSNFSIRIMINHNRCRVVSDAHHRIITLFTTENHFQQIRDIYGSTAVSIPFPQHHSDNNAFYFNDFV